MGVGAGTRVAGSAVFLAAGLPVWASDAAVPSPRRITARAIPATMPRDRRVMRVPPERR
jgi:hypothetical protein